MFFISLWGKFVPYFLFRSHKGNVFFFCIYLFRTRILKSIKYQTKHVWSTPASQKDQKSIGRAPTKKRPANVVGYRAQIKIRSTLTEIKDQKEIKIKTQRSERDPWAQRFYDGGNEIKRLWGDQFCVTLAWSEFILWRNCVTKVTLYL